MEAIYFKEVNVEIAKDQPQYKTLPAHVTEKGIMVTCFKLSPEEIKSIRQNGVIWVQVYKGAAPLQPLSILAVKDWFKQIEINDDGSYKITPDVHSSAMPKTLPKAEIRKMLEDYNHKYYSAVAELKDQQTIQNKYYEEYINPMVDWIYDLQGAKAADDNSVKSLVKGIDNASYEEGDTVVITTIEPNALAVVEKVECSEETNNVVMYKLTAGKVQFFCSEDELEPFLEEDTIKPIVLKDMEQITDHNTNVVAQFMNHCKDNGLDVPDKMFETYFNA